MLKALPWPNLGLEAQKQVINAQQALIDKIRAQQDQMEKLEALKQGLMEDLLAGYLLREKLQPESSS